MNTPLPLNDRILGAMLGLACGDALGAPAEFQTQQWVREEFGELRDMVGGGPWAPGEWTDDTGMTLCVARGILANPADPVPVAGQQFLEWRRTAKDVGSTISAVLSAYNGDWPQAAQSTPQARTGKAAGNGSLMRTLPVALAYTDIKTMLTQSARLSAMTHWDPQAEVCCAVYCSWIYQILDGAPIKNAWLLALVRVKVLLQKDYPQSSGDTPGPSSLPDNFWERLKEIMWLEYHQLQPSGYAGYAVECLEAAVWCCLHAPSLEEALVLAVNLAGEADTIAAIAGGAAGAYWGREAIPQRWLDALHERDVVEGAAWNLLGLREAL
jgi:ADP-ribosyl-[dinitrogen reductase] hydrolase